MRHLIAVWLLCLGAGWAVAAPSSDFVRLEQPVPLTPTVKRLTVRIDGGGGAVILADGWLAPNGPLRAALWLSLDGRKVGNMAVLDWHSSHHPVAHNFRLLASPNLTPGPHEVALMGSADGGATLGAGSGLSVLRTAGAREIADVGGMEVETDTPPAVHANDPLPHVGKDAVLTDAPGPVIALAAGNATYAGDGTHHYGDAFWGFWRNGAELPADAASFADNDICTCAELAAPLALQAYLPAAAGDRLGVGFTAEPWAAKLGPDPVRYRTSDDSALILLQGPRFAGSLPLLDPAGAGALVQHFAYRCVATTHAYPACPPAGEVVTLGQTTLTVPPGPTGALLFSAATRVQGDGHDGGGRFEMWLTLDGSRVGTTGLQDLSPGSPVSTRTVTASYLAQDLTPGPHVVQLQTRATGVFWHLAITRTLPLIWFN